jgi:hypothetical protein
MNTELDDSGGVTRAGADLARAAGEQLADECEADVAVGTGDEATAFSIFTGNSGNEWGTQTHLILMTTLPFARPFST